ncbi:MAG: LPXTG cell wall anchor domain-containing protein, partial [Anaerovoracaceae bacterium]
KPEPQEPEAYRLRLFSDRSAQQGLPINSYSRHVVGWFLVFDDTKIPEKYGPHPEKQPPTPITPDPVPTDPSTNPPVVTPVVPDTPVVPVPPVVEPVEPAKPDAIVEPEKPDKTTPNKPEHKSNSPQTGDNTNPWTWMIMFGMSGIGLGSILTSKKRKA